MNTYGNSSPKAESLSTGSFDAKGYIEDEFFKGVEPDSYMPVSEWADKYRILSSKSASEPGRWRTDRTPYLKEIMDCLSPKSPVQKVVFMKGAQIGGTECGNNWLGYVMHKAPGPIMAVSPTVEMAKRNSKQRIDPLIEDCPELKKLVAPARSRDSGNTMLSKDFPGGVLVMTGANSAVGLRSMPARYLFMDEIDGYPQDIDGEGDPILLAERRTATFNKRKKIFRRRSKACPTLSGSLKTPTSAIFLCHVLSAALISGWNGNRYRRKMAMCSMCASIAVDISVNITKPRCWPAAAGRQLHPAMV